MIWLAVTAVIVLAIVLAGWAFRRRRERWHIEVGQAWDGYHFKGGTMSVRLQRGSRTVDHTWVEMSEPDWEVRMGEAIAEMKQKRAVIKAASRIAARS